MQMKLIYLLPLSLLIASPLVDGANILAIFPFLGKSHWIVFRELLLELAARGHHMTVISAFAEEKPPSNWEQIVVPFYYEVLPSPPSTFEFASLGPVDEMKALFTYGERTCDLILAREDVRKLIDSKKKFDLLMIEAFVNDCFLAFAHKFNVPIVSACAVGGGFSWMNDMVGNPFPHSYIPEPVLTFGSHMTLYERIYNLYFGTYFKIFRDFWYLPKLDDIIQKHFKDPSMPPLTKLEHNISLMLVNTHVSFYYPRPLVPNMVEVGGMHIKPPKQLPKELQTFMDEATDGVIYFSMGSNVKSSEFPEAQMKAIIAVFARLKQKILWKFDLENLPNKPANLKISKWLPQNDILNHKNTKLFITHGGLMSIQEAISSGIPVLGIPVFGDQQVNMGRAQTDGYGIMLTLPNITEQSFSWALSELLTNPSYQRNIKKRSSIFHDRPEPPLQTAVRWTEYVIRHGGARHMRSAALDLSWYQLMMLDVACALLATLAAAVAVVVLVVKAVYRKVFSRKPSKQSTKKHKKNE